MITKSVKPIGRDSFVKVLLALTEPSRNHAALSYYYTDHIDLIATVLEMLASVADRLPDAFDELHEKVEKCRTEMEFATNFLKHSFKHSLKQSDSKGNAYQCATFAVGGLCDHEHNFEQNSPLKRALTAYTFIHDLGDTLLYISTPDPTIFLGEKKSIVRLAEHVKNEILHYAKHLVRDFWQSKSIAEIKDSLEPGEGMVVMDHKQKILATRQNEAQCDYYGKRGMSMLGAMLVVRVMNIKGESEFLYHFIDVVMKNVTSQKAVNLYPGIECILHEVKTTHNVSSVYIVSDNAGAFSAFAHIPFVHSLNQQPNKYPFTKMWLFSEAQCGKSMLDTHFSFVNIQLKRALLNNVNYTNEVGLYEALTFDGGIKGSCVFLVTELDSAEKVFHQCLLISKQSGFLKGIRSIHTFDFSNTTEITVHHQTGLSPVLTVNVTGWSTFEVTSHVDVDKVGRSADARPLRVRPKKKNAETSIGDDQTFGRVLHESIQTTMLHLNSTSATSQAQDTHQPQELESNSNPFISHHWAAKTSRTWVKADEYIKAILKQRFDSGVTNKKNRVTAEVATQELKNGLLKKVWDKRCMYTVGKVKSIYSTLINKQKKEAQNNETQQPNTHTTPLPINTVTIEQPSNQQAIEEDIELSMDEDEQTDLETTAMLNTLEYIELNVDDVTNV
jgi:hypothetical protein